jgi:hypothetical protein
LDQALLISHPDEPAPVLRQRFLHNGYLYFQQAISQAPCDQLLAEFVEILEPHISFDSEAGHPVLTGEPFFETDAVWDAVYPRMQASEAFHQFFHRPEAQRLMQLVAGPEVFVYPMKMARIATPRKIGYETPPHQDAHSHQAGPTMAGMWVALHDMTADMGRLKVLPYSHRDGVRKVLQAQGVGGVQCEIYPDETCWHVSDYRRGDVIIFHGCCVHKAEPNTATSASRMSVDTRFCDYGAPVFISNIEPHHGWRIPLLDWPYIYQGWQNTALQYYWRDYPNLVDTLLSERNEYT